MKNITISLPEDVIVWAKMQSARKARSFSRWIQELIQREQEVSMAGGDMLASFLALKPRVLNDRPTKREDIYDRPSLRRH